MLFICFLHMHVSIINILLEIIYIVTIMACLIDVVNGANSGTSRL